MSIKHTVKDFFFQYYYLRDEAQREIEDGYDMVHIILFPYSDDLSKSSKLFLVVINV
jgi:hypothetical protein